MSSTKYRWYLYKTANRLRYLEGDEFAAEIDLIIEDIRNKKLDKTGNFKNLIKWLEAKKAQELFQPKQKARQYDPFEIPKSGIGRIALFGLSNVGKSTLMNAITNTDVQIGNYLHTTTIGQAGACEFEDVVFQIVDLPGFLDFKEDWALSKQIVRVARTSEAIMMVIDLTMDIDRQLNFLIEQLENANMLIDGESFYRIAIIATKGDLPGSKESYEYLLQKTDWDVIPTAYNNQDSLKKLKRRLFEMMDIIRVYTKPPGEKPKMDDPLVLPKGSTVADATEKIHTSFLKRFRYARVWGNSIEFEGQQVGLDHELHDKDIIELVLTRQQISCPKTN